MAILLIDRLPMSERYHVTHQSLLLRAIVAGFLAVVLFTLGGNPASAQAPLSHFGRRFLIAYPDTCRHLAPTGNVLPLRSTITIVIFSLETANVHVEGPGYTKNIVVSPSASGIISLPLKFLTRVNLTSLDVFEITSDRDISIYCHYTSPYGSETFTPLPVSSWGDEYYVMGLPEQEMVNIRYDIQEELFMNSVAPAEIVVIASEQTMVTVRATAAIGGEYNRSYLLMGGEALLLESSGIGGEGYFGDLSGTQITATRPVGVISGNTRSAGHGFEGLKPSVGSGMYNSLIEWIVPHGGHGTTFAYRPISPVEEWRSYEGIRLYATAPGNTVVTDGRNGLSRSIAQGEFIQFETNNWDSLNPMPFTIRTSRPAQAMVVSGTYARPHDSLTLLPYLFDFWGPAMSELAPYERWISFGRYHAQPYPSFMKHYLIIVADTTADVMLDGRPIEFDPLVYPGFPYRQARVQVSMGDHTIRSYNGRFSAIAFGQAEGFEDYRPASAKKEDDEHGILRPHPSTYSERFCASYAHPVVGLVESDIDSLEISRTDECDSTVATIRRSGTFWSTRPLHAELDPASRNVDLVITPIIEWGDTLGFRFRFEPRDRSQDAGGAVVVTNDSGEVWRIPYDYVVPELEIDPLAIDMSGIPPGQELSLSVKVRNRKGAVITVKSVRLWRGTVGFSLPDTAMLPAPLGKDDSVSIPITFLNHRGNADYYDSLFIVTSCWSISVPLHILMDGPPLQPRPRIGGYDWSGRWLTTLDSCTKSGIASYDTVITIYNDGASPYRVRSVTLLGADADSGYFSLGSAPAIAPGTLVDSLGELPQQVIFRPKDERDYSCIVRLITLGGDTVDAELKGIGIESHIAITDHDFGSAEFIGMGSTEVSGSVTLTADGTRSLTVRGLRIGGANGNEFKFDRGFVIPSPGDPGTWWVMAPGDVKVIPLLFTPEATGARSGWIEVIADHPICGDSVGTLAGRTYTRALTGIGLGFDTVLACAGERGSVSIWNQGSESIRVVDITLIDTSGGTFTIDLPGFPDLPFLLPAGGPREIPVGFSPSYPVPYGATVRFTVTNEDGTDTIGVVDAPLTGVGRVIQGSARIDRGHRALPGRTLGTPVLLDSALDEANVTELLFTISSRKGMMLITDRSIAALQRMLVGTILDGWGIVEEPAGKDTLRLRLTAPPGKHLNGTGTLLNLDWLMFLGDTLEAELPFTLDVGSCARVVTSPGHAALDSICGMRLRLIAITSQDYALDGNRPNPFNPITAIHFSVGLPGPTTLDVYDGAGRLVARLADAYMTPGRYSVEWDASDYPSGIYTYRIRSGPWSALGRMILAK